MNHAKRMAGLIITVLLGIAVAPARAEVVTVDLHELNDVFVPGQAPVSAGFGFANVHAVDSFTLTILAAGTPGLDTLGNPVPAQIMLDVTGEYIVFDPVDLGPYGGTPTETVHDIPLQPPGFLDCIGCPQTYTLIGAVELSTPEAYPNLVQDPMVYVSEAYLTLEGDLCDGVDDPIGCIGFIGIAHLNLVLGNWNQTVPPADPTADWNSDGYIGIHDLNFVLGNWNAGTPPAVGEGDCTSALGVGCECFGCDGFVGIADLNIVLSFWNQHVTPGDCLQGDHDGDGYVGIADLNEVLGSWNTGTPPGAQVPEPTLLALFGIGCLLAPRRRG